MWGLHRQRCGGILGDEMGLGICLSLYFFKAAPFAAPLNLQARLFK
jgi:hypothetical protein